MKVALGFLLLVGVFLGVFTTFQAITPHSYSGTLLMEEEEYQDFKHLLAEDWVKVSILQSLSSDEHLVDFKVSIPSSREFPYGTYSKMGDLMFNIFMSGVITILFWFMFFLITMGFRKEDEK